MPERRRPSRHIGRAIRPAMCADELGGGGGAEDDAGALAIEALRRAVVGVRQAALRDQQREQLRHVGARQLDGGSPKASASNGLRRNEAAAPPVGLVLGARASDRSSPRSASAAPGHVAEAVASLDQAVPESGQVVAAGQQRGEADDGDRWTRSRGELLTGSRVRMLKRLVRAGNAGGSQLLRAREPCRAGEQVEADAGEGAASAPRARRVPAAHALNAPIAGPHQIW